MLLHLATNCDIIKLTKKYKGAFSMNNFLKVLIGLGAAAATAGIVISLAKKNEEPDFECDFEECGDVNFDPFFIHIKSSISK